MNEQGLNKSRVIAELTKSVHGALEHYVPIGRQAASLDAEFFAHLCAWNYAKGAVRDSKVALPPIALTGTKVPEFQENALALMASMGPREFLRAVEFSRTVGAPQRVVKRLVARYLHDLEKAPLSRFEHAALQHHKTLKTLYGRFHVKPSPMANGTIMRGEHMQGSLGAVVKALPSMSVADAAGAIVNRKIPFLIASGALGARMKEPDLVMAIMERMSPTELVTNTKLLERLGVKTVPALRAAYEQALERVSAAKGRAATLKTTRAAEALEESGETKLANKLRAVQEKQLDRLQTVEGDWLILADKSGSMSAAIETGNRVAEILGRAIKGKVHLVFFDSAPRYVDATGLSYEALQKHTKHMTATGNTSVGCGLQYILDHHLEVQGIVVISDGGENSEPRFYRVYQEAARRWGTSVPIYYYHLGYQYDTFSIMCTQSGIDMTTFELGPQVDYYSLPNLVQTMRAQRYGLGEEILDTPLATLNDVLERTPGEFVLARQMVTQ